MNQALAERAITDVTLSMIAAPFAAQNWRNSDAHDQCVHGPHAGVFPGNTAQFRSKPHGNKEHRRNGASQPDGFPYDIEKDQTDTMMRTGESLAQNFIH